MGESAGQKPTLGWREWVRLGTLDLPPIKAKIDTGARTSALHAYRLEPFRRGGGEWVRFSIHPLQRDRKLVCHREAPVIDRRRISDSGGHRQVRYVIESDVTLGVHTWPIELTLTSRETMLFRLLLGRTALAERFIVDPSLSYCIGRRPPRSQAMAPANPTKPLETGMNITIYHNPRCSKSRSTLQLLQDKGVTPTVVEYLKAAPSAEELDHILRMLGMEPRELMRKGESIYKEAGLDDPDLDRQALIAAMVEHPILIERPIVIANGKAAIGRPPEKILDIL
jgi:arsenate reductase (glutaredoxin)